MTTITYDGRYLAADTLGVRGGNRSEQPSCKIAVQDGYAFAFGGMWGHFRQQLMAWALAAFRDADPPEWRFCPAKDVEGALLVTGRMGGLLVFTHEAPYPDPEAWPFAIGTGGDIALGAMGAGVTAMEAVKLAMRWDLKTGGEVDFIDTEWLDKGVQRWDGTMPSARFPMSVNDGIVRDTHGTPIRDYVKFETTSSLQAHDGTTGTMEFETVEIPKPKVRAGAFVCRGSYMLGTACRQCERCVAEWQRMQKRGQDDDFAVSLLPNDYELKRGLLPAAHGHRNGVIGRAEMCVHGMKPDTCSTCRSNRTANLYPV